MSRVLVRHLLPAAAFGAALLVPSAATAVPCPAGQAGNPPYCETIVRVAPTSFTAHTTPRRDRTVPYRFVTTGRVGIPASVGNAAGCSGLVNVFFKVRQNTVSARHAILKTRGGRCVFTSSVTFHKGRLGHLTHHFATLRVFLRFTGNQYVRPKSHRVYHVFAG
jgi:hypothetical protein